MVDRPMLGLYAQYPVRPRGGWTADPATRSLSLSARDMMSALNLSSGEHVGFVLHELARDVHDRTCEDDRDALIVRARAHLRRWRKPNYGRFRISRHAAQRYVERIDPSLTEAQARQHMAVIASDAPFSRSAPDWTGYERAKVRGGYLDISDEVCFAVVDGRIRTVLTLQGAEEHAGDPDPFPDAGVPYDRPDPAWPDRRYVANNDGVMQCRSVIEGELIVTEGRTCTAAFRALRYRMLAAGLRDEFENGQRHYSAQRRELATAAAG